MKQLFIIVLCIWGYTSSLYGQEFRVQGNMLVLGEIESPFIGIGAGIEAGLGEHFSLSFDFNWSTQADGSVIEYRPAVNYYIKKGQSGFFSGVALKLYNLNENDVTPSWEHKFYFIGINVGYKALLSDNWTLSFMACPHFGRGGYGPSTSMGISAQLGLGYRF
ncbi:MAG: DUF3575 domain-containing protein [Saprospiraceae bacterium]|nr:DUF3575 domain-containing protein [Candidatus Opimibacter iunctus]